MREFFRLTSQNDLSIKLVVSQPAPQDDGF